MRSAKLAVVSGGVLVVAALVAAPVNAAPSGTTTATFEVTAGTLDITTPASATIGGGGAPGTTITGTLGVVTVADGRASANPAWTASVKTTDFTTGAAAASQTVLASAISYWSGPATATTGNGTFTPGQSATGNQAALDTTTLLTAFAHATGTGNNSASWNPTLVVHVPLANQSGTYTGTVTHSVA